MDAPKFIIAIACGVAAGAIAGFLVAPASGRETRKKISGATLKLKNRLARLLGKASDELDELKELVQSQTDGMSEDVRQRVLKLIASTNASYNNVASEATAWPHRPF